MAQCCSFARVSRRGSRRKKPPRKRTGNTTMIEIPIYNTDGKEIDKMQVDPARLGGQIRTHLLKQALVMYHANKRQGTVRTLARGEVAGSTRKIYKQKGTGNARTGGIRNPIKK